MNSCQRCGDSLREGAQFCIGCGTPVMGTVSRGTRPVTASYRPRPAAPPSGNRAMAAVALGALGVALAVTTTVVVVNHTGTVAGTASGVPAAYGDLSAPDLRSATVTATATVPPSTTTTTAVTRTTAAADSTARFHLDAEVSSDRYAVESLVGYWVPQVSSKQPGMVVHGVSYGYQEVWQDFLRTRERFPEALMLTSGDFPVYKLSGFWVTVVPTTFTTAAAANAWCDAAGFAAEDCYAKRLAHSGSSQDNTQFRQ